MMRKSSMWDEMVTILLCFRDPFVPSRTFCICCVFRDTCVRDKGSPRGPTFDEYTAVFRKEAPKQESRSPWTATGMFLRPFLCNLAWSRKDLKTVFQCTQGGNFTIQSFSKTKHYFMIRLKLLCFFRGRVTLGQKTFRLRQKHCFTCKLPPPRGETMIIVYIFLRSLIYHVSCHNKAPVRTITPFRTSWPDKKWLALMMYGMVWRTLPQSTPSLIAKTFNYM